MKALKNICAISLLLGATAFTSCTDLTEEIHSSVIAENYYNNAGEVMAAMMASMGALLWNHASSPIALVM